MRSRLFSSDACTDVQARIAEFLNAHEEFLSPSTVASTRAAGDAVEGILGEHFQDILGDWCAEYSASFARRAMADIAFRDADGLYYVVDVKTHREDTKFNMPNLTSVERLTRFYEDDSNYFVMLLVKYSLDGMKVVVSEVVFVPIEFLAWDCLTIGALGWGQIQVANSNYISVDPQHSRRKWMLELCEVMLEFYPKEIEKIGGRMEHFQKVKEFWETKPDD